MTRSCDAVVIGAGLAGLCAARDRREAGHEILLLEPRDRAGGCAWNRAMAGDVGKSIELGAAWINRDHHPHADAAMERYGLRLAAEEIPETFRWRFEGRGATEALESGTRAAAQASQRLDHSGRPAPAFTTEGSR